MKKINLFTGISLLVISVPVVFISCKKPSQPASPETLDAPALPATPYDYAGKHSINSQLATLGRVLFYDKNLSVNKTTSCGSCHKQEFAFADNVRFNKGANGVNLKRNSPSIQGVKGFFTRQTIFVNGQTQMQNQPAMPDAKNQKNVLLFWDGRQNSMSDMVLNPVLNHNEMNMPDFETLTQRLSELPYYSDLFKNAYGDIAISKERIAYALEGFLSCLNTGTEDNETGQFIDFEGTHFGNQGNTAPQTFLTLEEQGKFLFHNKYNCAQCHDPSNTGSYGSVTSSVLMFNIGLDENYSDNGLGAITGKPGDKGLFKVPTLKNIALTAPYMHDGRFADLGQVIDHYSHGIKDNPNLSGKFLSVDGTPKKLNIQPDEKRALIAFLTSLRDEDFLTSPMYSDPFKK